MLKLKPAVNKYLFSTFLIYSAFVAAGCLWLAYDTVPLIFDQAAYVARSLEIYNALSSGIQSFIRSVFSSGEFFGSYRPHRPLMPLSSALLYFIFGPSNDSAVTTNLFFSGVMFFSLYAIAANLFDRKTGVLAVFITASFPLTLHADMLYRPEAATAAMVTLSIYLMIASGLFRKRAVSLLLGVSLGLGIITKELFLAFLICPLAYSAFLIFTRGLKNQKINYLVSLSAGAGIALLWYIPHIQYVLDALNTTYNKIEVITGFYGLPKPFSLQSFLFYPLTVMAHGVSFFYAAAFCLAVFPFLRGVGLFRGLRWHKQDSRQDAYISKRLIILWIFAPYLFLIPSAGKVFLYYLPAFPAAALIISAGILGLGNKLLRRSALLIVILFGFLQSWAFNFGLGILPESLSWNVEFRNKDILGMPVVFFEQPDYFRPHRQDWKTQEIMRYIYSLQGGGKEPSREYIVGVLPNWDYISADVFELCGKMLKLAAARIAYVDSIREEKPSPGYGVSADSCDYIVVKTGPQGGVPGFDVAEINKRISGFLRYSGAFIKLPREFVLPDSCVVSVYQKNRDAMI